MRLAHSARTTFWHFLRVLFSLAHNEQIDFCDTAMGTHIHCDEVVKTTLSYCNCSRTRDAYCFFESIQVWFIQFLFFCYFFQSLSLALIVWLWLYYLWRARKKNDSKVYINICSSEFYEKSLEKGISKRNTWAQTHTYSKSYHTNEWTYWWCWIFQAYTYLSNETRESFQLFDFPSAFEIASANHYSREWSLAT